MENNSLNENWPKEFLLPLKGAHTLYEYDFDKIKDIIRSKIEKNIELSGRVFYIQAIVVGKIGSLGEIFKIGRVWI